LQEELLIIGGKFDCKVSGKDTDGDLCIYDTVRQEKGGPAYHIHHSQDEWFYIIKGEFIIKVGDDLFNLKAGDSAFAPRTIPQHLQKSVRERDRCWFFFNLRALLKTFLSK
jgi:mannose-6-phosphate isomerase-like protein (cupin superfamily)